MNKIINKNILFLGVLAIFLGLSQTASAAYVCEPYAITGTDHFMTRCFNTNESYQVNYSNPGGLGDSNYGSGLGGPIATTFGGTSYGSQYGTAGATNTTNTTNGASSDTNRNTTITRTVTNNKVATTTKADDTTTTNVSNSNDSADQASEMNDNGLSALSLHGSNSFLPDTVWEWICVFFLLLVIIILIRQFRKQGHHEVHTVAHH